MTISYLIDRSTQYPALPTYLPTYLSLRIKNPTTINHQSIGNFEKKNTKNTKNHLVDRYLIQSIIIILCTHVYENCHPQKKDYSHVFLFIFYQYIANPAMSFYVCCVLWKSFGRNADKVAGIVFSNTYIARIDYVVRIRTSTYVYVNVGIIHRHRDTIPPPRIRYIGTSIHT